MKTITLFSWGYYGWGNATKQLVKAVDAIEQQRGFEPPLFVDIRIRRTVRALGFNGLAFEKLLGERHMWMPSLGNKHIVTRTGKGIQIAKPEAVEELLDLAVKAAKEKRRLIFFCGCHFPKWEGKTACHRDVVAGLVLAAAKKRKVPVRVVEWPGDGRPRLRMELNADQFRRVRNGSRFVPVPRQVQPQDLNGPAWGSIMSFSSGDEEIHRLVGPLIWKKNSWHVPMLNFYSDAAAPLAAYKEMAEEDVAGFGLDARSSR